MALGETAVVVSSQSDSLTPPGRGFLYACLLTLAVLLVLFVMLTEQMDGERLGQLNRWILLSLHQSSCSTLDTVAILLTNIGGTLGTTIISCPLVALMWRRGLHMEALLMIVVLLGATTVIVSIKDIYQHPRPALFLSPYPESGYSFPSGHSLMSFCLYGSLGGGLLRYFPSRWWAWLGAVGCLLFALSIVWCRLYLGVHWPTDVTGGILLGSAWVIVGQIGLHYGPLYIAPKHFFTPK